MEDGASITPYGRIYTVANYVGSTVVSAFFASLERCSCIDLGTSDLDDEEEEEEESKERPLMMSNSVRHDDPHHPVAPPEAPSVPGCAAAQPASVDAFPIVRYTSLKT
ncbi:hypothetical protein Nepgr_020186 [Nepenthes gracilis]|uniref:Uncharacterized protein n=1 Tax=Nepenthes gracilis TaxID=150966 RepID=A0AAD3XVX9_NEPGR|nr:hypothetical protein Nepgr_020186 [Nepenthes gracilis]